MTNWNDPLNAGDYGYEPETPPNPPPTPVAQPAPNKLVMIDQDCWM